MWYLDYWKPKGKDRSPIEKDILKIKDKVRLIQLRKLVKLVEQFGPSLPMPKNKNLKGGLFELRDTATGTRYYYCETEFEYKQETRKIILLLLVVGMDKQEQQESIALARDRMEDISEGNILNSKNLDIVCKNED